MKRWLLVIAAGCAAVDVHGVEVEFIGAVSFQEAELRAPLAEQIAEIRAKGLTDARADDAAFFLGAFYRRAGYSRVRVEYERGAGRLVLRVTEGPLTVLRSVRFTGNRAFGAEELGEYLIGVKPSALGKARHPYQAAEVSAGTGRVRGLYANGGWLDAVVTLNENPVSADGTGADVVVKIAEGTRYMFGRVSFEGAVGFSEAELRGWLGAVPEGPLTPWAVEGMQRSLQAKLRGRGFYGARVTAVWAKSEARGGRVPVRFVVERGPEFRVGALRLSGLERVGEGFMERRLGGLMGRVYDPEALDAKYRELLRTGLFRSLSLSPSEDGPGRLRLDVTVEEAKQKSFGIEAGYGSYDGMTLGLTWGDRNFMGWGRPLEVGVKYSERGLRGEVLHVDPWFLDSAWSLRSRVFSEQREEKGYSKTAQGFRLDFGRRVGPRWEVSAYTEAAYTSITEPEIDPALIGPSDYVVTAVGVAGKVDFRDDVMNPRRGWIVNASVDLDAMDGELAFGRATARYSRYRALGRSLLAGGLRAGWIFPIGGGALDVPIDLRYFNGGGTTVRSFADRDLGPKDSGGNPLGGTFYTVANVEWDFPIKGALGGAVFVDAGSLSLSDSPDLSDVRYAVGLGLRYELPIGPVRLDYGFNPDAREGEDPGAVHFSFGFAF